jgi:hypothetical protein
VACGPAVPNNQTFLHELGSVANRPLVSGNSWESGSNPTGAKLYASFDSGKEVGREFWGDRNLADRKPLPLRDAKGAGWSRPDELLAGLVNGYHHRAARLMTASLNISGSPHLRRAAGAPVAQVTGNCIAARSNTNASVSVSSPSAFKAWSTRLGATVTAAITSLDEFTTCLSTAEVLALKFASPA